MIILIVLIVLYSFDGFKWFFNKSVSKTMVMFMVSIIMITIISMRRMAILTIENNKYTL